MRILVTGGRGQLGLAIQKVAQEFPGHTLFFTDMPEGNITDRNAVSALVEEFGAEAIVNCAAYTNVNCAESEPELAAKINAEGPRILAGIALERGIPLMHVSTDYVFDGSGNSPIKEEDATCPASVYGSTKLDGELAILHSGCTAAIIRTAWLYSEFGQNFVKTMLKLGRENGKVNVVYDQIGTPTYAPDLARVILLLAEQVSTRSGGTEIYHYSNEGAISWYDFAQAVFELSDLKVDMGAVTTAAFPSPARRPAYSVLSKEKIKALGIPVPYWRDSLRTCLQALGHE